MKPIRIWLYRGWCWICRRCSDSGQGHQTQQQALGAAIEHLRMHVREGVGR